MIAQPDAAEVRQGGFEPLLRSRHVDDDVEFLCGQCPHGTGDVVARRVQDVLAPQGSDVVAPSLAGVGDDDPPDAVGPEGEPGPDADRARADHQCRVADTRPAPLHSASSTVRPAGRAV